jgi:hypothetical protein
MLSFPHPPTNCLSQLAVYPVGKQLRIGDMEGQINIALNNLEMLNK